MTLTQAAIITKRSIVIFVGLLVLIVGARVGYLAWYQYQLSKIPPTIERPEQKFGVLPELDFSGSTGSPSNYSYSVDTETGELPTLPEMIKVYFIPQRGLSLLAANKSKELASSLDFHTGPQMLSDTQYRYTDDTGGSLLIDLPSGNFIAQKIRTLPTKSTKTASPSATFTQTETELLGALKNFLQRHKLMDNDLINGTGHVSYNGKTPSSSSEAIVSLLPGDIDNLHIYTSSPHGLTKASITALPTDSQEDIIESTYTNFEYIYWQIDPTTYSTYPLKTVQQALDDLKRGEGAILQEPASFKVSITDAHLGYYQTKEYSPYLQPVIVFEGPGFKAITPAIAQ
jgi:hypothetical protein